MLPDQNDSRPAVCQAKRHGSRPRVYRPHECGSAVEVLLTLVTTTPRNGNSCSYSSAQQAPVPLPPPPAVWELYFHKLTYKENNAYPGRLARRTGYPTFPFTAPLQYVLLVSLCLSP